MSGGGGLDFEEADVFEAGFECGSVVFLLVADDLVCFFLVFKGCFSRDAFDLDGCQLPASL